MYESYFNFQERPFASVARADHYFPAPAIEAGRADVLRCAQRAEGVGVIVGPSGTGKTLLCQVLAEQLRPGFQVALLTSGRLGTRRALLQAVLYQLGLPYRGMDEGELRLMLVDHVTLSEDCPQGIVAILDDAQNLPRSLLDELRTLTNIPRNGQSAVRLVLAGSRTLEDRLASPKLESLSQRITARCYLEPFGRNETQQYIQARTAAAGGRSTATFPEESCQSVYKATEGVPRLINQVCDHALLLAHAAGHRRIEPSLVEKAWADLQQLPTPWNEGPVPASSGAIEFGGLDDEPETPATVSIAEAKSETPPGTALRISPNPPQTDSCEPPLEEKVIRIEQMLGETEEEFHPAGSIRPEIDVVFPETDHPFQERFQEEEVVRDRYRVRSAGGQKPQGQIEPSGPSSDPTRQPAGEEAIFRLDGPASRPGPAPLSDGPEPDDSDMIVVEEGYDDGPPRRPTRPVVPVRRHEFARLFARLRGK